ncbi:MAG TPA: bifunctional riboflavin kinase/FAD synthetase [Alphaproteobacteria bacterium]|nr:bifunctional riboflavin kinase/FAD synthetase [Alphaproteobacteria bacterium]
MPQSSAVTGLRIFRHSSGLPPDARGSAVAIGNFDGVHLGHQAVISAAVEKARALDVRPAVLTFEPHPRMLFRPDSEPFRLTPLRPKTHAIEALGVEVMVVLAFDRALSEKSAEAFVEDVLVTGMAVTHILVGADFVFGHDRLGTVDRLSEFGGRLGFAVTALAPVAGPEGTVYSSTAIREALKAGEPRRAATLLGRPWEIEGRVEHGDARGRRLGFPTANIGLGDYLRPAFGVYAVEAGIDHGAATEWHRGVANLGRRPTVAGLVERLEVHLFDFDGDLYGRHLRVRLIEFMRPEKKFDGLEALQAQIARDTAAARAILAG